MKPFRDYITAIDIGTHKISCFIGTTKNDNGLHLLGHGIHAAQGLRSGHIIDMDRVQACLLQAVTKAEKMANKTVDEVIINVASGNPQSKTVYAELPIANYQISDTDIKRLLKQSQHANIPLEQTVLHKIPINFSVDDEEGIHDPRGMFGRKLKLQTHLIKVQTSALKNMMNCVTRCHLEVKDTVHSAYASGLACLVEDEMELGVTLIEMGAGVTSIAIFYDHDLIYVDTIHIGGQHVTSDIARGLSTTLQQAERMKALYGSAIASPQDDRETLEVPQIGEEDHHIIQIPKSMLVGIIQPRLEETFELIRDRIEASGFGHMIGRRVVLTGGASQLQGVRDMASMVLNKQVRLGTPIRLSGLNPPLNNPAFSTCAGLLSYAIMPQSFMSYDLNEISREKISLIDRFGYWLKENF